jgi:hypothetical protein
MNATQHEPRRLSDLPAEELDRLARAHVDGFFGEVRGAGEHVRTEWTPLALAKKHPVATAAVVGAGGLAVVLLLRGGRRTPRSAAAEPIRAVEPLGRTVGRTLLSGLAGSAATMLPELLMAYLRRRNAEHDA